MQGTQIIVEILAAEGIPFVVAYPGLGNESIISALLHDEKNRIRCILPRHERVGMDIVDGYARVSGEAGVGLVCGGPGSAHAFAGVAQSFADNIPVLLLKGQVNSMNLGTKSMLELPTVESFIEKIAALINGHFTSGGQQLQFNFYNREMLLEAKRCPEKHANLMVRVAGYSAPFVSLWDDLQDEIISHTEHSL